jgi:putative transposase
MRRSRFTEEQILAILHEADAGRKVDELCRAHGVARHTYYRWKAKFGGLQLNEAKRLRQLEDENRKLKTIVADLTLDNQTLKGLLGRKW